MKNIILFDNPADKTNLLPLTYTRPICYLRVGIDTVIEKWKDAVNGTFSVLTDDYLSEKFPAIYTDDNYFISGNIIPDKDIIAEIFTLDTGECLTANDKIIALRGTKNDFENQALLSKKEYSGKFRAINYLYDIFTLNDNVLREDFIRFTAGKKSAEISDTNTIIGNPDLLFIEEGAEVEGAYINTKTGPVYISASAQVMEGSCLRGPIALCEHSVVNMGSKIYGATTLGPWCKVGGELNNVVMIGFSNKAHDGFLGNAVIGEWCNIGAGCVASNLKNDYTEIKLWNYAAGRFTRTGLQFCGLIMGDHSKAGINTMFNTATVLGVGVNVYGSGFQRNFLASFSEGSRAGFTDVPMTKFFDIARRVMARRGQKLTEVDCRIFEHINDMAHNYKY